MAAPLTEVILLEYYPLLLTFPFSAISLLLLLLRGGWGGWRYWLLEGH